MADSQFSAPSLPAHAAPHPMARPGYGKRTTPGQPPRTAADFTHLPPREAAVAAYIDRLADGADISVKTLAKVLPYGQCALRTALNRIQAAGHLRRGREHLAHSGSPRWITGRGGRVRPGTTPDGRRTGVATSPRRVPGGRRGRGR